MSELVRFPPVSVQIAASHDGSWSLLGRRRPAQQLRQLCDIAAIRRASITHLARPPRLAAALVARGRGSCASHNGQEYGEALECLVGPAPIGQVSKRIQCKNARLTIRRRL